MRRLLPLLLVLALAGCDQNLTMNDQEKYHEWEKGKLFRNGQVVQTPVKGTVGRGELAYDAALAQRPPLSEALLRRGQERFDIFCSPCHSRLGDGNGMIVQRGMPHPPSFHEERLRTAEDEHFVAVITNGYGAMYSYAARVPPADRWAITAYIRALQTSQHASLADVPDDERRALIAEPH